MDDETSNKETRTAKSAIRRRPPSLVVGIGAFRGRARCLPKLLRPHARRHRAWPLSWCSISIPVTRACSWNCSDPTPRWISCEARDGAALTANVVHVIPPNATLTLEGDMLRVSVPAPVREYRRPIDTFFASLAEKSGGLFGRHHFVGCRQRWLVGRQGDQGVWRLHARSGGVRRNRNDRDAA